MVYGIFKYLYLPYTSTSSTVHVDKCTIHGSVMGNEMSCMLYVFCKISCFSLKAGQPSVGIELHTCEGIPLSARKEPDSSGQMMVTINAEMMV